MSNDVMVYNAEAEVEQAPRTALTTATEHPSALVAADPNNPAALLHEAVVRGASVEQLKELVGLHERIEERQARKAYFDAYARFQAKCPPIRKSSIAKFATNGGGEMRYTFAPLDEIARTVNPILTECGLSYTWDSKVESGIIKCVCIVRHVLGHHESAHIELPTESKASMSSQQKVGAALTFARRLSLTQALGITSADEDTDGRDDYSECISEEQVHELVALATEVKADMPKFLAYCGVESLDQIPAKKFAAAVKVLERKRKTS
jgi:hypothetical protein